MKIIGYNWNGTPIYGNDDGTPLSTSGDIVISTKKTSGSGNQTLNTVFANAGNWLGGIANVVSAFKGNAPMNWQSQPTPPPPQPQQNTNWMIWGALLLIIIMILLVVFKR